jgi:hypothetical protein
MIARSFGASWSLKGGDEVCVWTIESGQQFVVEMCLYVTALPRAVRAGGPVLARRVPNPWVAFLTSMLVIPLRRVV